MKYYDFLKIPSKEKILYVLENSGEDLYEEARELTRKIYGKYIYLRALIEFSNICKKNCIYCGLRRDNKKLLRFRMSEDEIFLCAEKAYKRGFRTVVLQSGEDDFFTFEKLGSIVERIKKTYHNLRITLSTGVHDKEYYRFLKKKGADRFLLRFESSDEQHFEKIHGDGQSLKERLEALRNLKESGYTVGSGMMTGSPYQSIENIASDIMLLYRIKPDMVGLGPFIANKDTPFKDFPSGESEYALKSIAIIRLLLPYALIPASTAIQTVLRNKGVNEGEKRAVLAGANVIMPNMSDDFARRNYRLYENKYKEDLDIEKYLSSLEKSLSEISYEISLSQGDPKKEFENDLR